MHRKRMRWLAGGLLAASVGLAMAMPVAQASPITVTAGKPELPAVSYKYTLSKIAWTGSVEAIAATDSHGDLYYFFKHSSASRWHKHLVAKGSSAKHYSKPAIAWTGHEVLIVALDSAGDLVTFKLQGGSSTWSYKRISKASGGKYQSPAVTVASDGTVLISVGNTSGQLDAFQRGPATGTWLKEVVGFGTFGPSSTTTGEGGPLTADFGFITATSGGNLEFWDEVLNHPGWSEQTIASAGPSGSYTGGSTTVDPTGVLVTAANTNGLIELWYQAFGTTSWTEEVVANPNPWFKDPQLAYANSGTEAFDLITAVSDKGTLEFWWKYDGASTVWTAETVAAAGTKAKYANPAIAITKTATVITAINSKPGDVDFWSQKFGATTWPKQLVAKG